MSPSFPSSDPVLAGTQAYRASLSLVAANEADLARIVAAAQAGDSVAREELATLCLTRAWRRALHLVAFYRALRGVILDPQDIAQEAALRIRRRMDRALAHPNPFGYLCRAIEGAMLTFCRERQTAVRVPVTSQWRGMPPVDVVSLDARLPGSDRSLTLADRIAAPSHVRREDE